MKSLDLWDKLAYYWTNIEREAPKEQIDNAADLVIERKSHRAKEKLLIDELMDEDDDC